MIKILQATTLNSNFFENSYLSLEAFNSLIWNDFVYEKYKINYDNVYVINILISGPVKNFDYSSIQNLLKAQTSYGYTFYNYTNFTNNDKGEIILTYQLNLYYTFLCNLFSENSTIAKPVFFKEKHEDRFITGTITPDFQKQYYLNNMPPAISNFSNNVITTQSFPCFKPTPADYNTYGLPTASMFGAVESNIERAVYLYWVFKASPSGTMSMMTIPPTGVATTQNNNAVYLYPVSANDYGTNWQTIGSSEVLDTIILPFSPSILTTLGCGPLIYPGGGQLTVQDLLNGSSAYASFQGPLFTFTTIQLENYKNFFITDNQLSIIFNDQVQPELPLQPSQFSRFEPLLTHQSIYKWGLGTTAQQVDICFSDMFSQTGFGYEKTGLADSANVLLRGMTIQMNYPNITLYLNNFSPNNNISGMFWTNKNKYLSLINLNFNSKITSISDNWTNFLSNEQNSYYNSKRVAQVGIAQTTANIVLDSGASAADLASAGDPFTVSTGISAGMNEVSKAANAGFDLTKQSMEYQYNFGGGKKNDMSRIAELSGGIDSIVWNADQNILWTEKALTSYQQKLIWNYIQFNGYIIEKYLPFNLWNNRKFFNWVKIDEISILLNPNFPKDILQALNAIASNGFRVYNLEGFNQMNQQYNPNIFIDGKLENFNCEITCNNAALAYWESEINGTTS